MSPEPDAFTTEHREILGEVAGQVAIGLQQARLCEELRLHNADLERRVDERTRQLTEANAELDSFAYSISHDLWAQLHALQGLSNILLEDELSESEWRSFALRIEAAATRLDYLDEDVLSSAARRVRRTGSSSWSSRGS